MQFFENHLYFGDDHEVKTMGNNFETSFSSLQFPPVPSCRHRGPWNLSGH